VIVQYPIEEEKGSVGSSSLHVKHYLKIKRRHAWDNLENKRRIARQAGGVPDNPVWHGPSSDAVRATRRCYPEGSPALTAFYVLCPTDLAWAMDERANLSCLRAERSDKVMFSGGFIRARPDSNPRLLASIEKQVVLNV